MNSKFKTALAALMKNGYGEKSAVDDKMLSPQLASLVEAVPHGEEWIFETKFDGYRIVTVKDRGKITLLSRNGKKWTHRFPNVAAALDKLSADSTILDGEIIVVGEKGKSGFSALQRALTEEATDAFTYYVFDIIYLNGIDLRSVPLLLRKRILASVIEPFTGKSPIKLSPYTVNDGERRFKQACSKREEGIIAKRGDEVYRNRRTKDWLKIKCSLEDEFVIAGYTDPDGSRQGFGALLLAYYDSKKILHYAGRVGTGFDDATLARLKKMFTKLEIPKSPFAAKLDPLDRRGAHFLKPELVAQIRYAEWTDDGRLRHAAFLGLREDKKAIAVRRAMAES